MPCIILMHRRLWSLEQAYSFSFFVCMFECLTECEYMVKKVNQASWTLVIPHSLLCIDCIFQGFKFSFLICEWENLISDMSRSSLLVLTYYFKRELYFSGWDYWVDYTLDVRMYITSVLFECSGSGTAFCWI